MSTNPGKRQMPDAEQSDPQSETTSAPRLEVTGTQVLASGLASVSAAIVSSIFGVAGTIIGAAVVSIVITLGSAIYSFAIGRTRDRLQQVQATRLTRSGTAWRRPEQDDRTDRTDNAAPAPSAGGDSAPADASESEPLPRWRAWLSERRWGVTVGVAMVFAASLLVVTAIELVGQQPLAGFTGGDPSGRTSIGSLFDSSDDTDDTDEPDEPDMPGTTTTTSTTVPETSTPSPDPGVLPDAPTSTTTRPRPETPAPPTTEQPPTTTTTTAPEPLIPEEQSPADETSPSE